MKDRGKKHYGMEWSNGFDHAHGKSLCHSFHLAHLRKIEVTGICHLMKFSYLRLNSFTSKPLCHPERIIWDNLG